MFMASAPKAETDIATLHEGSSSDEDDNDVLELECELEIDTARTLQLGVSGRQDKSAASTHCL